MYLDILPNETITHIFLHLPTVSSAIALSSTCHRFRHIYSSSKKLLILSRAAEREYGPLSEAIQLVTHNASQSAHVHRSAPLSEALLRSIVQVGRVAAKWEDIYPFKKWKTDFEDRRILFSEERYVLRRAIYRLWLFTRAFHNRDHPRTGRLNPITVRERAALLHNFSTVELAEMLDVHNVLRDTIAHNICPSNGSIRRKFQKRFPDSPHQLLFNSAFPNNQQQHSHYKDSMPLSSFVPNFVADASFYSSSPYAMSTCQPLAGKGNKYLPSRTHEPGAEGWGDDIIHYYVVEDMLKLDPAQILWLRDNAPLKSQVEMFVWNLDAASCEWEGRDGWSGGYAGGWFDNNGETFAQTLAFVVQQRGGEMEELKEGVETGELGVAVVHKEVEEMEG